MATDYNGWTNYETWAVNLWLMNDQGSADYWYEVAEHIYEESEADHPFTRDEIAERMVAAQLKDEIAESSPLAEDASMYSDLLTAALGEVNYNEIARHLVESVKEARLDV